MATIVLPRGKQLVLEIPSLSFGRIDGKPISTLAFASIGFILLFLSFIITYQMGAFEGLHTLSKLLLSSLFVVVAPALALVSSTIALRRYVKMHTKVRGMFLAYVSFVISSIYFVTALAMPFVLLGMYAVYVYIW